MAWKIYKRGGKRTKHGTGGSVYFWDGKAWKDAPADAKVYADYAGVAADISKAKRGVDPFNGPFVLPEGKSCDENARSGGEHVG